MNLEILYKLYSNYLLGFRDESVHIDELQEASSSYLSQDKFKDAFTSLQADYTK